MINKKLIITLIMILITVNVIFLPQSYAIDNVFKAGDDFLNTGEKPANVISEEKLKTTSDAIYKTLLSIAICVSVLIGAILGIQFILGSVEGKVKVQEALVPYIVGCFVVFGGFAIWSIVINIGNNVIP